jgi:hypothetical protein
VSEEDRNPFRVGHLRGRRPLPRPAATAPAQGYHPVDVILAFVAEARQQPAFRGSAGDLQTALRKLLGGQEPRWLRSGRTLTNALRLWSGNLATAGVAVKFLDRLPFVRPIVLEKIVRPIAEAAPPNLQEPDADGSGSERNG